MMQLDIGRGWRERKADMSYISGFVVAVPTKNKEAYRKMAADMADIFKEYGATEIMEAWGEDVRDGKVTDFKRAVQAKDDETVVFSWIVWPDRAAADAFEKNMSNDERLKPPANMPFDGQRMIFGGFTPIFEMGR
jgi:uncharacterized protein YbaA (DUF1428 family)